MSCMDVIRVSGKSVQKGQIKGDFQKEKLGSALPRFTRRYCSPSKKHFFENRIKIEWTEVGRLKEDTSKSKASQALLSIYNDVKEILQVVRETNILIKNINNNTNTNYNNKSSGTVTVDEMLHYLSKRPMWKLTEKQIYFMVERGDDIRYIQALSGYTVEEIKKKYERHKASNVYR